MGRPFLSSIPHTPRHFFNLRHRLILAACILALCWQQRLYAIHRISLAAKYSPTTFNFSTETLHTYLARPDDEDALLQQDFINNRPSWKVLGKGWEGTVYVYKNSVIKTFLPKSPLRNCAPGGDYGRWPTEIPGSLYFGGSVSSVNIATDTLELGTNRTSDGFLPVQGLFKASTVPFDPPEWHLVTPLLEDGNLDKLSKELLKTDRGATLHERDAMFRPAFNRLLVTLDTLHSSGYCHDDIKPGNIFVRNESHWVLGDLGNLREITHPYHSSRLWKSNDQLEDCRANDVMRLLKSYLKFIRSSIDADAFNIALFESEEPLSRLFWWALADVRIMSALELQRRSLTQHPGLSSADTIVQSSRAPTICQYPWSLVPRRIALRQAADNILMTRISETVGRWWAMVWLFGVPVTERCGV